MKHRKSKVRRKKIHLMTVGEARNEVEQLRMRGRIFTTYYNNLWNYINTIKRNERGW
jgi:hypothetical protein